MMLDFDPLRMFGVAADVVACNAASAAALHARQQARLGRLLEAARGSPLYRERLDGKADSSTPLRSLPRVTKQELMERFDDWVTDPQLKLADIRAFTADATRIAEPYLGKYIIWESSGTTHQPGIFVQDAQTMAVYDALEAVRRSSPRPLQRWMDPLYLGERVAFVGATSGHFASIVSALRLRRMNPWMTQSLRCFSIMQAIESLVSELNDFAPTVIATYPTAASMLADEALLGMLRITPKEVWTGGETLTPTVRGHIETAFDCTVRNSYGASEFLTIGWECHRGHLHVNADWVMLEPVDEKGKPVPTGHASCSTLLTNLANHVQPLIRYDLGDQITLHGHRCGCGSSMPVIDVDGRRDDALLMRGKNGHRVTLLPLALTTVLEDEAGLFDFQLRQRSDRSLVLRVPSSGAHGAAAAHRGCAALKKFAHSQCVDGIEITTEIGKPIPKGRTGKARRVVAADAPL